MKTEITMMAGEPIISDDFICRRHINVKFTMSCETISDMSVVFGNPNALKDAMITLFANEVSKLLGLPINGPTSDSPNPIENQGRILEI